MVRDEIIYNIRNAIRDFGDFNANDVNIRLGYRDLGQGRRQLIEAFYEDRVLVTTYAGYTPVGRMYLYYSDLPDNILAEILTVVRMWEDYNMQHYHRQRDPRRDFHGGRDWHDWNDWRGGHGDHDGEHGGHDGEPGGHDGHGGHDGMGGHGGHDGGGEMPPGHGGHDGGHEGGDGGHHMGPGHNPFGNHVDGQIFLHEEDKGENHIET